MSEPFPLHQLQTLVAIVDAGGFEAAARELGVSAPAVSQRVRALEAAAGRPLIHRTVPPELTAPGERLLPYARRLVALANDASRAVHGAAETGLGREQLPLAVNADSLSTWFIDALGSAPHASATDFRIERADQDHTAALLASGRVLGAVTASTEPVAGCVSDVLGSMRYLPLAAPALLARHGITPDDARQGAVPRAVAQLPMVEYDGSDELQLAALRRWLGRDATPPTHRVPSSWGFARAVEAGLGWGMVPEEQAKAALAAGALLLIPGADSVDVVLHWQRWDGPSTVLPDFSSHLLAFAGRRLRAAPPVTPSAAPPARPAGA